MYTIIYSFFPMNALIYGDIGQGIHWQSLFILPLISSWSGLFFQNIFFYNFWRYDHIFCGSSVLEFRQDQRSKICGSVDLWIKSSHYIIESSKHLAWCCIVSITLHIMIFDSQSHRLKHQTPMDLGSGITSKTKLL